MAFLDAPTPPPHFHPFLFHPSQPHPFSNGFGCHTGPPQFALNHSQGHPIHGVVPNSIHQNITHLIDQHAATADINQKSNQNAQNNLKSDDKPDLKDKVVPYPPPPVGFAPWFFPPGFHHPHMPYPPPSFYKQHPSASKQLPNTTIIKQRQDRRKKSLLRSLKTPRLSIEPTIYQQFTLDQVPWCMYCGSSVSESFKKGPWGDKTLCKTHSTDFRKSSGRHLDLTDYSQDCENKRKRPVLQDYCWGCFKKSTPNGCAVIMCDGCPRAYHRKCFEGDIPAEICLDDTLKWYCSETCKDSKQILIEFPTNAKLPLISRLTNHSTKVSSPTLSTSQPIKLVRIKMVCSELNESTQRPLRFEYDFSSVKFPKKGNLAYCLVIKS